MDQETIDNNFVYHAPKDGQPQKYESIRALGKAFAEFVTKACPPSREAALAITNIEQAVMWANASIARNE